MPKQYSFKVGATRPGIDGTFLGVDLTGATITVELENFADGTTPAVGTAGTVVSATSARTKVRFNPTSGWPAGDYYGQFKADLGGQIYYSPAFTVKVGVTDKTPVVSAGAAIYNDGRSGYATLADVSQLMRNRDGFSAETNEPLIEMLLGDTAVELDRALELLYAVPIVKATSPKAYEYVRVIHKYWALAALHDLLIPIDPEGMSKAAVVYREKGAQMLDDLVEGSVILGDAIAGPDQPASPSGVGAEISSVLDPDSMDFVNNAIFSVDDFSRHGRGLD